MTNAPLLRADIRDPLYQVVRLSDTAVRLIDTPAFQRLRHIRQLGMAHVVYPTAEHKRFQHAIGAYHVAGLILRELDDRGDLSAVDPEELSLCRLAALLHDVAHYPAAHFLEEYGMEGADHEAASAGWLQRGEIGELLDSTGIPQAAARIGDYINHRGTSPLVGVVSGACDADKIDYIARDAHFCCLEIGFDRQSLLSAMALLPDPVTGRRVLGLRESGLAAFEQMLFAKFNLYREVLFNKTVRAATVMLRTLVVAAREAELITLDELLTWTDEDVFTIITSRVGSRRRFRDQRAFVGQLAERIQERRLYTQATSLPLSAAPRLAPRDLARVEARLAATLGLESGEVLLDIPNRPGMLSTDLLVERRSGEVVNARSLTPDDGFALNAANLALYHASGRMGVFTARPMTVSADVVQAVIASVTEGTLAMPEARRAS